MRIAFWFRVSVASLLLALPYSAAVLAANTATSVTAVRVVNGTYDDVKARVVEAIENRGLVLNYTARIGEMLARTGKDIGRDRAVFDKAELFEFCSAAASRDMMEADPHNIVFCPYAIAVYTLPKITGRVYVSYRRNAAAGGEKSAQALRAVDKLLADIVNDAAR